MLISNTKVLMSKLGRLTVRLLDEAAGFTLTRTQYQVGVEHFLLKAIEDAGGDIVPILRYYEVDPGRLQQELLATLEDFPTGNSGRPAFSPHLLDLMEQSWLVASVDLSDNEVRSGYVLLALCKDQGFLATRTYGQLLGRVEIADLIKNYDAITKDSTENKPKAAKAASGARPGGAGGESFLAQYTIDFTAQAAAGKIDPVFGRDREIREMIDILARRRKNNPIVVGEAGVGKTAVVEGLALRVTEGDVPDVLTGVSIHGLDMGLLQAGTGVKGEFEKRLKGVIDEVKASETPIIMFIDEAHTIIGAGGPAGGSDAANLLKPPLARGELRTIAATTWSEYKKYFEKDVALARRFQLVKLDEPSPAATVDMLRGLKAKYEEAHKVSILDQAVVAAANLSARYISGRQLPDKAVDLIDTAAARVRIGLTSKPGRLDDLERRLASLDREINALTAEKEPTTDELEELEEAKQKREDLAGQVAELTERWEKEKGFVAQVQAAAEANDEAQDHAARVALKEFQGRDGLVKLEVDADCVGSVVTDWTGIPLSKMVSDEARVMLDLEARMKERIKGQDWALETLAKGIRASKAGVKSPNSPTGVFLLVGPSGVGKTETALVMADELFGGQRFVVSINMSEFQERHTVSRLIGSPPGYVGYGEGGRLTEAVRQRPYSIVLLDETEKAHPDVLNLFYQVFDKGILNDGEGREIDFKNTLILLTSNLATDTITKLAESPVRPEAAEVLETIRPELSQYFKPALLARMTVVPYLTLGQDSIKEIVQLKLNQLAARLYEGQRLKLVYGPEAVAAITDRCTEVEEGARNIDHILAQSIMPRISTEILEAMAQGRKPSQLTLGYTEEGFTYQFDQ
ncbi:MAG: type VI secretion system ATPase TssH [Deltaproteobacteria bacterium]|nr:type VI secretion system ATPase TssH [Deltaproteobacteria bacterium]